MPTWYLCADHFSHIEHNTKYAKYRYTTSSFPGTLATCEAVVGFIQAIKAGDRDTNLHCGAQANWCITIELQ